MQNPVYNWSLTVHCSPDQEDWKIEKERIEKFCEKFTKKWAFQREIGEEKRRPHYQIMISLKKKNRLKSLIALFNRETDMNCYACPISSKNGDDFSYAMKEETRAEGPWEGDEKEKKEEPMPMPDEIKDWGPHMMRPWQLELLQYCQETTTEMRKVKIICDPTGSQGKGCLTTFLDWNKFAVKIPALKDGNDIMGFVCSTFDRKNCKTYMFDVVRAHDARNLKELFKGIESLKDGFVYDKRYKGVKIQFTRPRIIIFTNFTPKEMVNCLSLDRWDFNYLNPKTWKLQKIKTPGYTKIKGPVWVPSAEELEPEEEEQKEEEYKMPPPLTPPLSPVQGW